jgi:hypothetical protein
MPGVKPLDVGGSEPRQAHATEMREYPVVEGGPVMLQGRGPQSARLLRREPVAGGVLAQRHLRRLRVRAHFDRPEDVVQVLARLCLRAEAALRPLASLPVAPSTTYQPAVQVEPRLMTKPRWPGTQRSYILIGPSEATVALGVNYAEG